VGSHSGGAEVHPDISHSISDNPFKSVPIAVHHPLDFKQKKLPILLAIRPNMMINEEHQSVTEPDVKLIPVYHAIRPDIKVTVVPKPKDMVSVRNQDWSYNAFMKCPSLYFGNLILRQPGMTASRAQLHFSRNGLWNLRSRTHAQWDRLSQMHYLTQSLFLSGLRFKHLLPDLGKEEGFLRYSPWPRVQVFRAVRVPSKGHVSIPTTPKGTQR
jgi:hypothetical protein